LERKGNCGSLTIDTQQAGHGTGAPGKGEMAKRELINPSGTEKTYRSFQFSQANRVGDTVWVSGQVGIDENRQVGEGIEAQTRIALGRLQAVLEEAGATLGDVVELVSYHTDMAELAGFMKVKAEFFPDDFPAWTAVGVTGLAGPDFLVEVKATAVIGSGEAR
jgi:enamine deaminase RidA (YjgF/YER057c/UK114 family)